MLNTYSGLIVTYVVFTFPFCVWMLTAFFKKIPRELEECAHIDGASNFRTYLQIVLPLSTPGLAASAIFTIMATWKEFLYAYLLLNKAGRQTLTVGMYGFLGSEVLEWGELLAFNTLMIIPILIIFTILQRSFIQGLTAGAVKG
jgi:multiple sugar transport system permease protein